MTIDPGRTWRTTDRFPVQHALDGDFAVDEILTTLDGSIPSRQARSCPEVCASALAGRLWHLGERSGVDRAARAVLACVTSASPHDVPTHVRLVEEGRGAVEDREVDLLHCFETSRLWRPPVDASTLAVTPTVAEAWLVLAEHWIGISHGGDQRFLNAACKLLGAVWTRHRIASLRPQEGAEVPDLAAWQALNPRLATVAQQVQVVSEQVLQRLRFRLVFPEPTAGLPAEDLGPGAGVGVSLGSTTNGSPVSVVVLAAVGSSGAIGFLSAAANWGVPVRVTCWYESPVHRDPRSNYTDAWYPPAGPGTTLQTCPDPGQPTKEVTVASWDQVAAVLQRHRADLVVLLGMPIVPARILRLARLGVINAHNGALPSYRGMDAVAWALMYGDAIVCTLHLASAEVDTGDVLASEPVPFAPAATLRGRVKTAQLRLLLAAARFAVETSRLPDACAQPARGARRFYPLHPHLKRILDQSAYSS